MTAAILHALGSEAPREALIAVFGLAVGWLIAHVKIDRPARKRHAEVMAAHQAHADNLKQIRKQL